MKIIPYIIFLLGIFILWKRTKRFQFNYIPLIICYLTGVSAIIYGLINILMNYGLRNFILKNIKNYQYYCSFISGVCFGWVILFIIVEIYYREKNKAIDDKTAKTIDDIKE